MPRLSDLIADEADLEVELDHGSIMLVYRPRILTSAWQLKIARAESDGDDLESMLYGPIKDAVISWDLDTDMVDGDGNSIPYPITSEAMADIPRQVLMSILVAIVAAARPNLQRVLGASTDGSSEQLIRQTRRTTSSTRNGTR